MRDITETVQAVFDAVYDTTETQIVKLARELKNHKQTGIIAAGVVGSISMDPEAGELGIETQNVTVISDDLMTLVASIGVLAEINERAGRLGSDFMDELLADIFGA